MAKTFTFTVGNADDMLKRAKAAAAEAKAVFHGDTSSGGFEGSGVKGTYRIEGTNVTVTITDKPFIAPWSVVESRIRKFFTS